MDELHRNLGDHEAIKRSLKTAVDENSRMSQLHADRLNDIDALRRKIAELEGRGSIVDGLQARLRSLETENENLKNLLGVRMKDMERMYKQLAEYHNIEGNILEQTFSKMKSETDAVLHSGRP